MLLGISIWTKFFPALIVVYFLWKREWRVVGWAILASLSAVAFQILVSGLDTFLDYYTRVLPNLAVEGQPLFAAANHSVLGFAQKTFLAVRNGMPLIENETLMQITRWSLSGMLVVALFYLSSRSSASETTQQRFDLEYTLALTTALLLGSTMGYYAFQAALLPMMVIWKYTRRRKLAILWFIASLLLINFYLMLTLAHLQIGTDTRVSWVLLSTPFFGLMILWGWLVLLLRRAESNRLS